MQHLEQYLAAPGMMGEVGKRRPGCMPCKAVGWSRSDSPTNEADSPPSFHNLSPGKKQVKKQVEGKTWPRALFQSNTGGNSRAPNLKWHFLHLLVLMNRAAVPDRPGH